jgi:2-amino-4-hydroxy-6-hydroxymethyldihydropteridine diphosphokinase
MTSKATRHRAYLALGSNIAAETNLPAAVERLADYGRVKRVSTVWESRPVGDTDQPNFLNAAVLLETSLSAEELKRVAIAEIERCLQRVRDPQNKNAARTIDIDIALFNQDVLSLGENRIPDPDILTRPFLAVPLAELDPEYVHPTDGQTLHAIAEGFEDGSLIARADVQLRES